MTSYIEWNQALIGYFLNGVPHGTLVYLSVDDDVLDYIGQNLSSFPITSNGGHDFLTAVQQEVIVEGQVDLGNLQGCYSDGLPKGVAFLGATVLAAYQMAETDKISEQNYFRRLRAVFSLSGSGRLPGMKCGYEAEEPLWLEWNRWLMKQGFLPSAQRGRGISTTYINYPISQALLRRADKDKLLLLFQEKQWTAQWDAQTLFVHIRREALGLSHHLRELFDSRQRHEAVAEAVHMVYQQWLEQRFCHPGGRTRTGKRYLFAGLYRTEDPFLGLVDYFLYPKQVRGRQLNSVEVWYGNNIYQLGDERPGWYFPLVQAVDVSELEHGAKYEITYPADLDSLILPVRDFWILIPDPDNPDSGSYASWGTPSLGTLFILLCKQELLPDIQRLQDEQLLKCYSEPLTVFNNSNWVEFHQCMVVSQAWDGVFIKNQELKDALQPSVRLSISFSGGLRVPQMRAWLLGNSPQVTIFGFYPTAKLQITRLLDDCQILDSSLSMNTPISVEFPSPGEYLVEATCGSESSQRFIRIVDWSCLSIEKISSREVMPIGSQHHICGSVIEPIFEFS